MPKIIERKLPPARCPADRHEHVDNPQYDRTCALTNKRSAIGDAFYNNGAVLGQNCNELDLDQWMVPIAWVRAR